MPDPVRLLEIHRPPPILLPHEMERFGCVALE